ncbi:nucleotide binding protein PINc [Burkholderia pseudomallei]|uniref:PIN domain-containing protein n=1 Tax=Burkholderia pseudomallei TaxID=28450 RepID=UPI000977638A|nr:PIN domain-containing protein [Burkholderia pseudomallei]MBF3568369.1 PIN domain-containing protein [Burkholderia pseudomallei]OMS41973.1 PIN domain-containing protein [Burkholderia pseudomallei]CAJ2905671.1 nucleotide binding protein PINc [Burkholderia pseudomallei]CAJ4085266.1 toxin-antitoxin system toxin component, PIN family [Burkholderia pseudomallei]CAJ4446530.1 toxin-antitoxin system toxin component, PIN family [Burkholderia pseudomallei]
MPSSDAPRAGRRVVLDSNVWIDILVFDDPAARPIRDALETGAITALIDVRCLIELERVLDYPQFKARAVDKAAALATVARLSERVAGPERGDARSGACGTPAPHARACPPPCADAAARAPADDAPPRPLPKCRDRDDQKFLELAYTARADWLVSKDRALLKLTRRTERDFGFRIAQPAPFAASALAADASEPA